MKKKARNNSTYIWLIITVVGLLSVFLVCKYFLANSQPKIQTRNVYETAEGLDENIWKNYVDVERGFSFQYPETFNVSKTDYGVTVIDNDLEFSVFVDGGSTITYERERVTSITIDGFSGEQSEYRSGSTGEMFMKSVRFNANDKEFTVNSELKNNATSSAKIIDRMISTLNIF